MALKRIAGILMMVSCFGCDRADKAISENAKNELAGPVFVTVNGRSITADSVRDIVLLQARMMQLARNPIQADQFTNWANNVAMQLVPGLVSSELLNDAILRSGESPDEEDVAKTLTNYCYSCGFSITNRETLAEYFGPLKAVFNEQFERSARFAAYARRHFSQEVTEAEISEHFSNLSNQVQVAEMIDKSARKKAEAAWGRLKAGEAWEKVAKDCSEDKFYLAENEKFSCEWADVGLDGFSYPELAAALPTLKKGDYSRPLETEEGLLIVKVIDVIGNTKRLARIMFRMAQPVVIPSAEEVRAKLTAERYQLAQLAFLERLRKEAKIDYPMGTNFTYLIWKD